MSENDQPFSNMYESYSLESLNGNSYRVDGFKDWPSVFDAMKPTCPKCQTKLGPEHFDKSNA